MFITLLLARSPPPAARRDCYKITTLPESLVKLPSLKKIDVHGCNVSRPPQATCEKGLEAMRRYWAELAAASVRYVTLKMVLAGAGEAGKTSLLRRLRDRAAAVLPEANDRTIGLEMAVMGIAREEGGPEKLVV